MHTRILAGAACALFVMWTTPASAYYDQCSCPGHGTRGSGYVGSVSSFSVTTPGVSATIGAKHSVTGVPKGTVPGSNKPAYYDSRGGTAYAYERAQRGLPPLTGGPYGGLHGPGEAPGNKNEREAGNINGKSGR